MSDPVEIVALGVIIGFLWRIWRDLHALKDKEP